MSNNCVRCGEDTTFGSGRFVNRIPHFEEGNDGYMCSECASYECCRCGKLIALDHDISPDMVFGEDNDPGEFPDGSWRLHEECLTKEEKKLFDIQMNIHLNLSQSTYGGEDE